MNPPVYDKILSLFSRENITLALSLFGATGTFITFISSYITKRKNLKIKITEAAYNAKNGLLLVTITFENHSQLPIAITSVSFLLNECERYPFKYPKCVEEYAHQHGKEVVDRKFLYNLNFPVDIQ